MEVEPIEVIDSPDLPPLWKVFGGQRRSDGRWALPELAAEVASPDAALHIGPQFVILETAAADLAAETSRHRSDSGRVLARDVPGPRQGRPVPRARRISPTAPTAWSPSGSSFTTKAPTTRPSPQGRTCSAASSRDDEHVGSPVAARRRQHVVPLLLRGAVVDHRTRRQAGQRAARLPRHRRHADHPGAAGAPGGVPRRRLAAAVAGRPHPVVQGAPRRRGPSRPASPTSRKCPTTSPRRST